MLMFKSSHDEMKDLQCMSYTSKGNSEILVSGGQDIMFIIDVDKGTLKRQLPTSHRYYFMKRSRHICAATQDGTVNILDSTTFKVLKTWHAHSAFMSDMDAQHDYIVTCGFSRRGGVGGIGAVMLDPFVNVFDLKNLVALPPIPFPAGAAYVRMHPRMSTTSIVVSQLGQMHVVDLMNVNTSNVRQANMMINSTLNRLEIAPSGQAIAIADSECYVHLWGSPSSICFAEVSNPVEYPDPDEDETQLEWSNDAYV